LSSSRTSRATPPMRSWMAVVLVRMTSRTTPPARALVAIVILSGSVHQPAHIGDEVAFAEFGCRWCWRHDQAKRQMRQPIGRRVIIVAGKERWRSRQDDRGRWRDDKAKRPGRQPVNLIIVGRKDRRWPR